MTQEEIAKLLLGSEPLAWALRKNGEMVIIDNAGKKWVYSPDRVKEARASDPKGEPAKPGRARAKKA